MCTLVYDGSLFSGVLPDKDLVLSHHFSDTSTPASGRMGSDVRTALLLQQLVLCAM
jgi:hypothetical protein